MTLEQAREAARQVKAGIDNGFDPGGQVQKRQEIPEFDVFVKDRYLPYVKLYKRSWDQDEKMIARHLSPIWGRARLSDITEQDIRKFLSGLLAAGYKPGSVNRLMALTRYIFSLAEKWEVIDKSPVRGGSRVADNNRKERFLTKEETGRLLAALGLPDPDMGLGPERGRTGKVVVLLSYNKGTGDFLKRGVKRTEKCLSFGRLHDKGRKHTLFLQRMALMKF